MDIQFNCPRCGQHLTVDDKAAGLQIECPTCKGRIPVPAKPASSSPTPVSPPPSGPATSSGPSITQRSGWSTFLIVVGVLSLVGGLGGCGLASLDRGEPTGTAIIILVCGVVGGLQAFYFAFLTNVFTDIRWFLKQLVDKR